MTNLGQRDEPSIDRLSSHYSIHTGDNIDIYTINDINILNVIVDKYSQNGIFGAKGHEGNGLYRAAIRKYKKFLEEYFKLLPEPKPDAVGTTIMPLTSEEPGENEPATQLRKVEYRSLNGKQKRYSTFINSLASSLITVSVA